MIELTGLALVDGGRIKRTGLLFGSLLLTMVLYGVAYSIAPLFGEEPAMGAGILGFGSTLIVVFELGRSYFDVSPPPEFRQESEESGSA